MARELFAAQNKGDGEPLLLFPTLAAAEDRLGVEFWHGLDDDTWSTDCGQWAGWVLTPADLTALLYHLRILREVPDALS